MHVIRHILLASLLCILGCSALDDPLSAIERRQIVAARARWNASSVRNAYRYEVRQSCFCPPEVISWNTVTVIDGVVVEVRNGGGALVPEAQWRLFLTVDRIFTLLEQPSETELEDVRVAFDAQVGYPLAVEFRYSSRIADAGLMVSARNLVPAPVPAGR